MPAHQHAYLHVLKSQAQTAAINDGFGAANDIAAETQRYLIEIGLQPRRALLLMRATTVRQLPRLVAQLQLIVLEVAWCVPSDSPPPMVNRRRIALPLNVVKMQPRITLCVVLGLRAVTQTTGCSRTDQTAS